MRIYKSSDLYVRPLNVCVDASHLTGHAQCPSILVAFANYVNVYVYELSVTNFRSILNVVVVVVVVVVATEIYF